MNGVPCVTGRLTLTVPEAGKLLGLGKDAAYAAAQRGEIPARNIGRRLLVPTHALLHDLGMSDELIARLLTAEPDDQGGGPAPTDPPPNDVQSRGERLDQHDPDRGDRSSVVTVL